MSTDLPCSIAASVFSWFITASIAELASAIPSSGGGWFPFNQVTPIRFHVSILTPDQVYHWASITAGRYGRICGFFAGWWNFLAWIFGLAATAQIVAAQIVSMYSLFHPDFVTQRWHVFVTYLLVTRLCGSVAMLANRALPTLESIGAFLIISGVVIVILVCAIMPHVKGIPYATNAFVWQEYTNSTGWSSNGLSFVLGLLNGAFAVNTPDVVTHLAEEIPV